jgi:hypothetical protein
MTPFTCRRPGWRRSTETSAPAAEPGHPPPDNPPARHRQRDTAPPRWPVHLCPGWLKPGSPIATGWGAGTEDASASSRIAAASAYNKSRTRCQSCARSGNRGRKIIAHPEDRMYGPCRRHLTYWKRTPLRQLPVDKPAHDLVVDRELVLVHPHEHRAITPHGTKSPERTSGRSSEPARCRSAQGSPIETPPRSLSPSRRRHARRAPAGPTHRLHQWHPEQTYAR